MGRPRSNSKKKPVPVRPNAKLNGGRSGEITPIDGELIPPGPSADDGSDLLVSTPRRPVPGAPYDPVEYPKQAAKLCMLGATDAEIANFFGVNINTLCDWKSHNPEMNRAFVVGKTALDARVERSLYARAVGYTYDAVKIFVNKDGEETIVPYREHVPPSEVACIFWLKNRQPDKWRDVHKHQISGGVIHVHVTKEDEDL